MKQRHPKEKKNCVYCGKDSSTFCGYWKLISIGRYETKRNTIIDTCYAHIQCYLWKHRRIIQLGVNPLCIHNEVLKTPKQFIELLNLHGDIRRVKNTIKFLQKIVKEWEKVRKIKKGGRK